MAVVLIADIPGMSRDMYRHAINQVRDQLKAAPGFIAHAGTPTPDGFRVIEFWESQEDCTRYLESAVRPLAQEIGLSPFQPEFLAADEAFTR